MPDLAELLERAESARRGGNPLVARGYLRRASRIAPERLDIWQQLCEITESPAERLRCLEHIVELDPENKNARAELAALREQVMDTPPPQESVASVTASREVATDPEPAASEPVLVIRPDITEEMRREWDAAVAAGQPLMCINHPRTETGLRCNRCGAPICTRCAVRTPVGLRCRECIKAQQSAFYTARWYDYPLAALIALLLSVPSAYMVGMAGWWFALIISPFAGGLIGGLVHRAVGRRRGPWLWLVVAVCIVLGAFVALVTNFGLLISVVVYAVTASGTAIGILRLGGRGQR